MRLVDRTDGCLLNETEWQACFPRLYANEESPDPPHPGMLPALSPGERNSSEALLSVSIPPGQASIGTCLPEAWVLTAAAANDEGDAVTGKGGEESEERFGLGLVLLNVMFI